MGRSSETISLCQRARQRSYFRQVACMKPVKTRAKHDISALSSYHHHDGFIQRLQTHRSIASCMSTRIYLTAPLDNTELDDTSILSVYTPSHPCLPLTQNPEMRMRVPLSPP